MAPPPGAVSVAAIILETEDPDPARTQACLRSLAGTTTCVYLAANEDGPTAEAARREGADVVAFADVASFPGRARNAGYRALGASAAGAGAVYFGVDDIVVAPGWLNTAAGVLDRRPEIGAVFGPVPGLTLPLAGASVSDGEADAAAQSVLVRTRIFEELGGMRGALVANDLADLCLRMRRRGARVWRIGETMGKSDRVRRLGWWAHSQREGFAAAHGASLHGAAPDRFRVGELRAAVLWGGAAPGVVGLGWAAAIAVLPLNSGAAAAFAVVATAAAAGLAGRMVVGFLGRASAGQALGSSVKAAFVETASFTPRFLGAATFLLSGQTAQRSASGRRPAAA